MTEEVQAQEQEVQTETAADDGAFMAGFAEARGDEPPTQPEPKPETTPEPEAVQEPVAEAEPVEEPVFAGLTESQLKAALAKVQEFDELKANIRRLDGRYGEFNARLQQVMTQPQGKVEITAEMFEDLNRDFPEFAESLVKGLSKLPIGGSVQAAAPVDLTPLREEVTSDLDQWKRDYELKLLAMRHRDWRDLRETDDFKIWEGTLPAEEREKLNTSWDALYVADRFDEFKAWRDKAQTNKQQKTKRLEAATTPRGAATGPSQINDEDAFMAGFKNVRRA